MRKLSILSLVSLLISCAVEVDLTPDQSDPITVGYTTSSADVTLEHPPVDVFFFNIGESHRFKAIRNNQEIEIPVTLNLDFDIPEDSYGYQSYAEKVIQLNPRYDLVKGTVIKFLESQEVVRNDTIFNLQGFTEQTNGELLLFDKQTFEFIELEEGAWINIYTDKPIQVIDNKLYYIKRLPNSIHDIRVIDLDNLNVVPQTFHSSEFILSFLINAQMDLYVRPGSGYQNRYMSHETGETIEFFNPDYPLKSHFIGIDGQFYAQHFYATSTPVTRGFYAIDVQPSSVLASPIYVFDSNEYPGFYHLGVSDIVIPNAARNNDLIIGYATGVGAISIYELYTATGSINPINIPMTSPLYADYYNNDFFILKDISDGSGNSRLRKFNLSNYTPLVEISLGQYENGITLDKMNGSVYCIAIQNEVNKLVKISSNNTVSEIILSNTVNGYFSILN